MRTVLAVVIGIMLIGLTATTSLAIKDTSGGGELSGRCTWSMTEQQEGSRRKTRVGRGRATLETAPNGAFMGVEGQLFGLSGPPNGGAFFGGNITVTTAIDFGSGAEPVEFNGFTSVDIPYRRDPGPNGTRVSLSQRSIVLTDTVGLRAQEFVNFCTGSDVFSDTPQLAQKRRARASTPIAGEFTCDRIRTSGSLSVDRRTFNRYRGRLTMRYSGTVNEGPNAGAQIRGVVSLRAKGERGISTKR